VTSDVTPVATSTSAVRVPGRSARQLVRRALAVSAAGGGAISVGLYATGHSPTLALSASVLLGLTALVGTLIGHLRGMLRDVTYRAAIGRLPETAMTPDTIVAMTLHEAVASRQMDSADLAELLASVVNHQRAEISDDETGT
jgi:hypothetical protein